MRAACQGRDHRTPGCRAAWPWGSPGGCVVVRPAPDRCSSGATRINELPDGGRLPRRKRIVGRRRPAPPPRFVATAAATVAASAGNPMKLPEPRRVSQRSPTYQRPRNRGGGPGAARLPGLAGEDGIQPGEVTGVPVHHTTEPICSARRSMDIGASTHTGRSASSDSIGGRWPPSRVMYSSSIDRMRAANASAAATFAGTLSSNVSWLPSICTSRPAPEPSRSR